MGIFQTFATAALLVASAGRSGAFAPSSTGRFRSSSIRTNTGIFDSALCAATGNKETPPCEAPSGVEAILLEDAKPLKNALVTNIKGEMVSLGDAMSTKALSAKTFDTSVVVFLRHMG